MKNRNNVFTTTKIHTITSIDRQEQLLQGRLQGRHMAQPLRHALQDRMVSFTSNKRDTIST